MNSHLLKFSIFAIIGLFSGAPSALAAEPASVAGEFQNLDRDHAFSSFLTALDLESGAYGLGYKDKGTSLGLEIYNGDTKGKVIAKWLPENEAANIEGQVVSYHLGRFLGMGLLVIPSGYFTVHGKTLSSFQRMLDRASESNSLRLANQSALSDALSRNPNSMQGALMPKLAATKWEVVGLADTDNNTINRSHPIASFINVRGPMPSNSRAMTFHAVKTKDGKSPSASELDLAREFSMIMVLDLLGGQWDRWSGGNVEATYDPASTRLYFIARDNGGSTMVGTNYVNNYLNIVSRFDRGQIVRVQRLVQLLSSPQAADTVTGLRLRSNPASLLARANALLKQVNALVVRFGDAAVFFPN
jgi:hypothetical protein